MKTRSSTTDLDGNTELPGPDNPLLALEEISKCFAAGGGSQHQALHEVSLQVVSGRVTGLVGADGAGKTTLLRIAAGLLVPNGGQAKVVGLDSVTDTLEIQSRVGYMPQKFGLYQDLSVAENMRLYADLQDVPPKTRKTRFARLLEMTDLTAYTGRRAGALSGGMKQKLGLACALIKSPELLLLDEPTVGVDPVSRRELWKIVDQLVADDQIGVLVATAYLDEAESCDEVVVLHEGRVFASGPPATFTTAMKGRTLTIQASPGTTCRGIYTRLAGHPEVVDMTIRAGRVRVVVRDAASREKLAAELAEKATVAQTAATFEDAFMALLPRSEHSGVTTSAPPNPSGRTTGDVVHTHQLSKRFGTFTAVDALSFSVTRGEIFGLLGPNGAGKSTTFRMLCGLLTPSDGELAVAGHDFRLAPARVRARLGYMAQQFSLYSQLTVRENLTFFGKAYGLSGKRLGARLAWAFDEFSLTDWSDTPAGALPGGNKQRLAMAAALLHEPDILFLDEPTSGVDPFARREFWQRINTFAEHGTTVVVTTHFMEEAEYCDRMLIMNQGRTLALGTPDEIRALARCPELPEPSMDDAFIALAEGRITGTAPARAGETAP